MKLKQMNTVHLGSIAKRTKCCHQIPIPIPFCSFSVLSKLFRASQSATMADKPSRGLVIVGDGLARFIDHSHTHLHALASLSSCGLLSLPNSPPSESEEKRMIRELALLFDTHVNKNVDNAEGNSHLKSIPERFMAMRAALLTNNSSVQCFGSELGVSVLGLDEFMQTNHLGLPPVHSLASELLGKLGFQDGKIQDTSEFDLLFMHIGVGDKVEDEKDKATLDEMKYIDALVGNILQKAQPRSDVGTRLHLSLVMSHGNVFKDDECSLSVSTSKEVNSSDLSVLFPRQSYMMIGEVERNDVRHHSPMLAAQWQCGVTRKDKTESFSFKEFKEQGSSLVIPADRFIHEVAFKLWKAPKYGA